MNEIEIFYPKNTDEWRNWLATHHLHKKAVWLVYYSKKSLVPTITWREAVDIALCFGWIDSKRVKINMDTSHQYFSPRKPNSAWSKINKDIVLDLIKNGAMMPAGLKSIEIARQNGSWNILDDVENLITPQDLLIAFENNLSAYNYYKNASKSIKKRILTWLVFAKKTETRQKRIIEILHYTQQNQLPPSL